MVEPVVSLPAPVPASITVTDKPDLRLSPNEMRLLKAQTGRTLGELLGEKGDDADRIQTLVWLELRRLGHAIDWEAAGDVNVAFEKDEPDPTIGEPSKASPDSVTSGE